MPAVSNAQLIAGFYAAIFNRAPDPSGLTYWEDQFNVSASIYTLAAGFTAHPVFTSTYGSMANRQFVESIYQSVLGAPGDSNGIDYWTAKLDGGEGRSTMLADFVHDALTVDVSAFTNLTTTEREVAQARQDSLTNKVNVGLNFAEKFGDAANLDPSTDTTTQDGLLHDPAYLASQAAIANVNADPASVTTANEAIVIAAASPNPVQALLDPVFIVFVTEGVVTFANGTGDIVMTVDGDVATFTRGEATAELSVSGISLQTIDLAAGQTLDVQASDAIAVLNGSHITGAGTVNVIGAVSISDIAGVVTGLTGTSVVYTLVDGAINIGGIATANVAAEKAFLLSVVHGATNHADLTLDVTYSVITPTTSLEDYSAAIIAIGSDPHGTVGYATGDAVISLSVSDYNAYDYGYVQALIAAGHSIVVVPTTTSFSDYQQAAFAIDNGPFANVGYATSTDIVDVTVGQYNDGGYSSALLAATHAIQVNLSSDSLNDYLYAAQTILGHAGNVFLGPFSVGSNAVQVTTSEYINNPDYVAAITQTTHPVEVIPATDSLTDYQAAALAIANQAGVSIAAFEISTDVVTLTATEYTANPDYVAALVAATHEIQVTAASDSLTDYQNATAAILNHVGNVSVAAFDFDPSTVSLNVADYSNNPDYVAYLLAASHTVQVTAASDSLGDYRTATAAIEAADQTGTVSVAPFATNETAITLTTSEFRANTDYVDALVAAGDAIHVTPVDTSTTAYDDAVSATDVYANTTVVFTTSTTNFTVDFTTYTDNTFYIQALEAAGHPIHVTVPASTLESYITVLDAIGTDANATAVFTGGATQPAVAVTEDEYFDSTDYITALEAGQFSVSVSPNTTSLSDYITVAAEIALRADTFATIQYTTSNAPITLSTTDYSGNHAYVLALEAATHTIVVNPVTTSPNSYAAAVTAISGDSNASVAFATDPSLVTLNMSNYSNSAYVAALHAAGHVIVVNPTTTSIADYNTAVTAVGSATNTTVAFAANTATVTLTIAEYNANTNYVAALVAATHPVQVPAASTTLTDYNLAVTAIHGQAGVSIVFAIDTTAIPVTTADYIANAAYVAALGAATHAIKVTPLSASLTDYNAAVTASAGNTHATVVFDISTTAVTLSLSVYQANSAYVTALGVATHAILVTPASTTVADYNQAVTAILGNTHASIVFPVDNSAVTMSVAAYGNSAYVAALEAATHTIVVNPASTSLIDYSAGVVAIGHDLNASLAFAVGTSVVTLSADVYQGNAAYVTALLNATHPVVVTPATTSLTDYNSAVTLVNGRANVTTAFATDPSTVTVSLSDFSNSAYVSALEASTHGIFVTPISTSLTDYNNAAAAIIGHPLASVTPFSTDTTLFTLTTAQYTANPGYVAALLAATHAIAVTPLSDSLTDYQAAVTAINGHTGTVSIAAFATDTTLITLTTAQYTANPGYVAALLAATHAIAVTPLSDSLTDYKAAAAAIIDHTGTVSIEAFATATDVITLTTADYIANPDYVAALIAATHPIQVTVLSYSLIDYQAAENAIDGHDGIVSIAPFATNTTLFTLTTAQYTANPGYVAALLAATHAIAVTPFSDSLADYQAAVTAINGHTGTVSIAAFATDTTLITLTTAQYTANPGYVAALLAATHAIAVTPFSDSLTDYQAAVTAINGHTGTVSIAAFATDTTLFTLTTAQYTANPGYVAALLTATHAIAVTPFSDSLADYQAAVTAINGHTGTVSIAAFATDTTLITLTTAQYTANPGYVAALLAATHAIAVTPLSDSLTDYKAAAAAIIDHTGTVSIEAFATATDVITLTTADYIANPDYVAALIAATHPIQVTALSFSLTDYQAAVTAINGHAGTVSIAPFATDTTVVTLSVTEYGANTAYVTAVETATHNVHVTPAGTSATQYSTAVTAISGDSSGYATVVYGTAATAVTMTVSDYGVAGYKSALEAAGHTLNVTAVSTLVSDYTAAVNAIGSDTLATVVFTPTLPTPFSLTSTDYVTAGYAAALEAAGYGLSVSVAANYTDAGIVNNQGIEFHIANGVTSVDLHASAGTGAFDVYATNVTNAINIIGSTHSDYLVGGSGNDTLTGGLGNDIFNVEAGSDTITDLTATDALNVSADATATATGVLNFTGFNVTNNGTVIINGTSGADTIVGTTGHDVITSNGGIDTLTGNGGDDTFNVNGGTSTITDLNTGDTLNVSVGATANTTVLNFTGITVSNLGTMAITGTSGNDTIVGTAGNDLIKGGAGADTLAGGTGVDTFKFSSGDANVFTFTNKFDTIISTGDTFAFGSGGTDAITDFATGTDKLNIEGVNIQGAAYVNGGTTSYAAPTEGDVFLVHGNYDTNSGLFSVTADGSSTLAIYNNGGAHVEGIVLTGVTNLVPATDMVA